ncbi:CocE/NonD family hydrolase [Campylobacter volucris]|uniref:CocE/NonD family hydrolase n=1 Tax=Campylobacter volucris TaxID=1031542 RepID=UPI0018A09FDD|nr:CocE/NonD family hydrolase [Campylobacter volucris]MBF7049145.1 CocE/NonD family hydrolase [Campylobacter volucris]MBF7059811.1 CocE/NonD family hydrolase [Campylobacter volucris]
MKKIIKDFKYEVKAIENEWIVLKDGIRLSARIWLPQTNEKIPAILEYIPYRKNDGTRTRDEPMHGYFAGNGYAVVRVDMRGSGESDGLLKDEYLKQEQDDALEVIEWIAKQKWCNGNVGMMGKSWGGFNSLQVAARKPKNLKAIIVVGFTDDRYNDDIHYKGGCLLNDNFWWGNIMLAYQSRFVDPKIDPNGRAKWLNRLENMPLWPSLWLEHTLKDEYWKHGSVSENYDDIEVPVFALDGWADSYTNPVFTLMQGLKVPKKAIIGPWAHVYPHDGAPLPAMGFLQEALKWWDKWLKNINNDVLDCPMIQAYIENSIKPNSKIEFIDGRFVGIDDIEKDIQYTHYYLNPYQLKQEKSNVFVKINTPLNHGLLAGEWMGAGVLGESPCDQRLDDGMAVVFESEILQDNLDILGFVLLDVKISSDKEKAMLFAQLSEVRDDGFVQRVSYGVLNLALSDNKEKFEPLEKDKFIVKQLKLDLCGHRFLKGSKIRLSLANTFWPMFWPMPEISTLTLDLSECKISLPIFNGKDSNKINLEPQSAPLTPLTLLKDGRVDRTITYDVLNDTWTCITDGVGGVFGEGIYRFDEIDVLVEHNLRRELTLKNDDPLSAKYTIAQKMKIGRENCMIDADIILTQTSDMEYFYIKGDMKVKENEKLVFEKKYNHKVKRNSL